jgi:membrane protease YdiL (CAAX protease family)
MSGPEYPEGLPPREPAPEPEPATLLPPLGVPAWAPLVAVLLVIMAAVLINVLVGSLIGITGGNTDNLEDNDAFTILLTVLVDAVLVAAPIVVVTWLSGRRPVPAAFGLRVPEWRSALKNTLAIYAGFWVAVIVIGVIAGQARDQEIVTELKAEDSAPVLVGFVVMTCVAAPLAEEFFFRGFLFRVLWERTNVSVATLATGVAFGLVHAPDADWIGVSVLSCLGAGLCLVLWRTASLLPCIMLHSFHNSISFGFTKELPWWGFLLLIAGSVTTTLAISLLATRLGRRVSAPPVPV